MTHDHHSGTLNLWFQNSELWMEHSHCVLYDPGVIFLDFWGNIMVGATYMAIPLLLLRLILGMWHEMSATTKGMTIHLAVFVLLCGLTHFIHAYNWTHTAYTEQAALEILTGVISLSFAYRLFFYIRHRRWLKD